MSRLDGQIKGVENTIAYLKQERKDLNKKIMTNRQNLATCRNMLKELKEKRRLENDQGDPGHDQSKSALG